METVAQRVAHVRERIAAAAARAGRRPDEIRLVGVAKSFGPEAVRAALAAGITDIGENRVQEARAKQPQVGPGPRWHLVGTLQTNKVGPAVELFDLIHSLDGWRLAEALSRRAAGRGRPVAVLVQVNVAPGDGRRGVPAGEALAFLDRAAALPGLVVRGLMVLPPPAPDPEAARPHFRRAFALWERARARRPDLALNLLSMGMSQDLEVAVEEGANVVRVGRGIFGPRPGPEGRRAGEGDAFREQGDP